MVSAEDQRRGRDEPPWVSWGRSRLEEHRRPLEPGGLHRCAGGDEKDTQGEEHELPAVLSGAASAMGVGFPRPVEPDRLYALAAGQAGDLVGPIRPFGPEQAGAVVELDPLHPFEAGQASLELGRVFRAGEPAETKGDPAGSLDPLLLRPLHLTGHGSSSPPALTRRSHSKAAREVRSAFVHDEGNAHQEGEREQELRQRPERIGHPDAGQIAAMARPTIPVIIAPVPIKARRRSHQRLRTSRTTFPLPYRHRPCYSGRRPFLLPAPPQPDRSRKVMARSIPNITRLLPQLAHVSRRFCHYYVQNRGHRRRRHRPGSRPGRPQSARGRSAKFGFKLRTATTISAATATCAPARRCPTRPWRSCASFDAIFLGAIGHPDVKPGILEKGILLRLRFELDQYINLRPGQALPRRRAPLKDKRPRAHRLRRRARKQRRPLLRHAAAFCTRARRTKSPCRERQHPPRRRALPPLAFEYAAPKRNKARRRLHRSAARPTC